jgi:8-hydroxy-5-deazaflavin:NADPH oxidoreductase
MRVGFGKIGQALAHAFARKNIAVTVASRWLPEALAPPTNSTPSILKYQALLSPKYF